MTFADRTTSHWLAKIIVAASIARMSVAQALTIYARQSRVFSNEWAAFRFSLEDMKLDREVVNAAFDDVSSSFRHRVVAEFPSAGSPRQMFVCALGSEEAASAAATLLNQVDPAAYWFQLDDDPAAKGHYVVTSPSLYAGFDTSRKTTYGQAA